jgi:plastocyanin
MRTHFKPRLLLPVIVVGIAAFGVAPALGGQGAESSATKRVSVRDDVFSPRNIRVASRDKVIWRWRGDNPHNVRFRSVPGGASRRGSDTVSSGRFARTFRQRGRYRYVCTIHADIGMRGSVRVE